MLSAIFVSFSEFNLILRILQHVQLLELEVAFNIDEVM